MGAMLNFMENKLIDWYFRAQAIGITGASAAAGTGPTALFVALLTCTKGPRANSTVYALNDTLVVLANDGKWHYYKVTTAGTSAAAQSTLYPGVADEAIVDGTATMTEQQLGLDAATAEVEVAGGSYARQSVTSSLANWAGTQGAASTTASTGTSGTTSNNAAITFPAPTANWGFVIGYAVFDAMTGGNGQFFGMFTTPKTINNGDAAPSFAAGALSFQIDN